MAKELKGRRILLVDDDPDILASIQANLEDSGAELKAVSDGHAATEALAKDDLDIVVLDMMLPGRSGFLVLEKIRSTVPKGNKPYVIMITANSGKRHQAYAEALGVDDYITKPFAVDRLVDSIVTLCSG